MERKLTTLYPMVQFAKDSWEIDEFDCASIFLLIGKEKALLIDCGMGIGDLRGAVEMLTDKPVITVLSHGHIDHTANAVQFEEIWLHPADRYMPVPEALSRRRLDTERIAARNKGSMVPPYNLFHLYPYDINIDLREPGPDDYKPVIRDLYDGQVFDLGGRTVTVYECPGHTAGEVVFVDSQTGAMVAGDALNFNLGISAAVETAYRALKRIESMKEQYTGIYNGHHDFRALGMPLDEDCLPTVLEIMEDVLNGHANYCEVPSFWGQAMPLTRERPGLIPGQPQARRFLRKGRNFLGINPDLIFDTDMDRQKGI